MRVIAVIVAGGRSARMGREKAFEQIGGLTIVDMIISRLALQVARIAINANGDAGRFRHTGLQVVPDFRSDVATPLVGLHAALSLANAEGYEAALTVPSDAPFLPDDLVVRLAGAGRPAAITASQGQAHYLTGLWSVALLPGVAQALDEPRIPRLQDWAERCGAAAVTWPVEPFDPFFNVNTPEELAEARRIAAEFLP
jgi:molybdopterin-guanine dinucleotide biosynthesis protein A